MAVLVTGGAGYIGSHTVLQLLAAGHAVVILDNLSNASVKVLDRLAELGWLRLQHGDTDDLATLEPIYLGQAVRQQP